MWPFRRRAKEPRAAKPRKAPWDEPDLHGFAGVTAIRKHCLELILEAAKASHPREFGGFLRAEKGVIEEVILLPGTISGEEHAIFHMSMLPYDPSIKGSVHSHPSPYPYPSEADLDLFNRHGRLHIIVARPYTERNWRTYAFTGDPVRLDVVD